jgi:hypothetical protein
MVAPTCGVPDSPGFWPPALGAAGGCTAGGGGGGCTWIEFEDAVPAELVSKTTMKLLGYLD